MMSTVCYFTKLVVSVFMIDGFAVILLVCCDRCVNLCTMP